MKLGMIGLGRMGGNMATRLIRGGHSVIGFDPNAEARKALETEGGGSADSLEALVAALPAPRALWMMVPAGKITDQTVEALAGLLAPGDVVIDGGNSNYKDTLRRAEALAGKQVGYVDCGTSGGVWGLAEGFSILQHKQEFALDLHQVAEIWRHGSVVRSWLLDLTADALGKTPGMDGISPWVADSGEGRWTLQEAIDLDVPAPVIALSLISRLRSRDDDSYADKLLAAMRNEFGGHAIKKA